MDTSPTNPLYIFFFFFLRCVVPLGIMLGISYLLKKLGLVAKSPAPPPDDDRQTHNHTDPGGYAHEQR